MRDTRLNAKAQTINQVVSTIASFNTALTDNSIGIMEISENLGILSVEFFAEFCIRG